MIFSEILHWVQLCVHHNNPAGDSSGDGFISDYFMPAVYRKLGSYHYLSSALDGKVANLTGLCIMRSFSPSWWVVFNVGSDTGQSGIGAEDVIIEFWLPCETGFNTPGTEGNGRFVWPDDCRQWPGWWGYWWKMHIFCPPGIIWIFVLVTNVCWWLL